MALPTSASAKTPHTLSLVVHSALLPLTLQGDTTYALLYRDWSDNERVLLSLADQFKISRNKLKFP